MWTSSVTYGFMKSDSAYQLVGIYECYAGKL